MLNSFGTMLQFIMGNCLLVMTEKNYFGIGYCFECRSYSLPQNNFFSNRIYNII